MDNSLREVSRQGRFPPWICPTRISFAECAFVLDAVSNPRKFTLASLPSGESRAYVRSVPKGFRNGMLIRSRPVICQRIELKEGDVLD